MHTSPLNLKQHIKKPSYHFVCIAFLDALIIAFFFALFGSRFISSPGISINVPEVSANVVTQSLKASNVIILTIKSGNMVLFNGGIHNFQTLPELLRKHLENKKSEDSLVLIKADKNVEIDTVAQLSGIVKSLGISHIQLATNTRESTR